MTITMYPAKFEGLDETGRSIFVVEMQDEFCASVGITTVVDVSSWDEISAKVREALVSMNLTVGAP